MSKHIDDAQLSGYLDGGLPMQEMQAAKEHLHGCPACAARLERMRSMIRILRETPEEEPPAVLKDHIRSAIAREAARVSARQMGINRSLKRWTAAAAAFVVVCASLTIGLGGGPAQIRQGVEETASSLRAAPPAADGGFHLNTESSAAMEELDWAYDEMEMPVEDFAESPAAPPAAPMPEESDEIQGEPRSGGQDTLELQKIVYTAHCTQSTYAFQEDRSSLLAKVNAMGGFVQNNTTSGVSYAQGGSGLYSDLTLRIPQKYYAEMMGYLSQLGTQEYVEESADNIGQVYADESIRLQNLQAQHEALLELMDQASSMEDILLIRTELNSIATQIEQSQSDLRNMDQQISYATIYVTLQEKRAVDVIPVSTEELTLGERIREALYTSLAGLRDGSQSFLVGIVGAAPYLGILAFAVGIVLVIVLLVRRKIARKKN